MALHWNLSRIKNHKTLCWERRTQAQLDAEGNGETLESLVSRMTFFGSDWSFPDKGNPLENLAETAKEAYIERMNPVTKVIVMATMAVDLGRITEESYVEFYTRLACLEKVNGAFLRQVGDDNVDRERPITLEEVKAHVGLKCNVADTSWFSFSRKIAQQLREKVCRLGSEKGTLPSVYAKDCLEMAEVLQESIEELGYCFSHGDAGEAKIERCQQKARRVQSHIKNLIGDLEEAEALVQDDEQEPE